MTWWQSALLGLLQGLTEFLPVSSSGHLVLFQHVLGIDASEAGDVTFEVFVHFGTAMSILTVYRREIWRLLRSGSDVLLRPASFRTRYASDSRVRTLTFILITLIPTGVVYIVFKDSLEAAFENPRLVSGMLLVTGVLLLLTLLRRDTDGPVTPLKALIIGIAQSAAMIPGISRSGSTICAGIYQNVDQEEATNFSFIIVLPVILGATLLKLADAFGSEAVVQPVPLIVGTVIAYVSGIIAIRLVLAAVRGGNLSWFAYYCFVIGGLGLLFI